MRAAAELNVVHGRGASRRVGLEVMELEKRRLAARTENGQREDGSVTVPEALRPYFGAGQIG